jgi:cytochrome P450 / NADPH-cytochrome P450 reductase
MTLLSGYVELSQPATTRDIQVLLSSTTDEDTSTKLRSLLDSHQELIFKKRVSVLDILESHPSIKFSLGAFLHLLPPMRVRQYSISSSPLWNPTHVTLTLSVVTVPALSGRHELFLGVASNYIASLRPGDKVQLAVRASATAFHAPVDPKAPMVMFAAGSGLAPMRGFIQERAIQKASGREVGKMMLFFGCRDPEDDYLYADAELREWIEQGVVDVRPAFSRRSELSLGCRYVQESVFYFSYFLFSIDILRCLRLPLMMVIKFLRLFFWFIFDSRIWHDRVDLDKLYHEGAYFYTCGSSKMATGVKEVLAKNVADINGLSREGAASTLERISKGRYATDIFD